MPYLLDRIKNYVARHPGEYTSESRVLDLLIRWDKVEKTLVEWEDGEGNHHSFDHVEWKNFVASLQPDDFVALSNILITAR